MDMFDDENPVEQPNNKHVELAILAHLKAYPDDMVDCIKRISPDMFYAPEYRRMYSAMVALWNRGDGFDTGLLVEEVGDELLVLNLLTSLVTDVDPYQVDLEANLDMLVALYLRRSALTYASKVASAAYSPQSSPDDIVEILSKAAVELAKVNGAVINTMDAVTLATALMERVERAVDGDYPVYISTGIEELDALFEGGWAKQQLHVLFARPGVGKSLLAGWCALQAAIQGHNVLYISLEMPHYELMERFISALIGISFKVSEQKMKWFDTPFSSVMQEIVNESQLAQLTGRTYATMHEAVMAATGYISTLNLSIDDNPGHTIPSIKASIISSGPHDLVFVDHMFNISVGKGNRFEVMEEMFVVLQQMARELDIALVALSQGKRGIDSSKDKVGGMGDVRYSGDVQGNRLISLGRDTDVDDVTNLSPIDELTIAVVKNRSGSVGKFKLTIDYSSSRPRFDAITVDLNPPSTTSYTTPLPTWFEEEIY